MSQLRVGDRAYRWTGWVPFGRGWPEPVLSAEPGLYRTRRSDGTKLDYIGQAAIGIRVRVGMLRRIAVGEMPYRDPHTAGPVYAFTAPLFGDFMRHLHPRLDEDV